LARQARSALVALDILELLQIRAGEPIGVSEVSRQIGINKATSHTVLKMLESRGYATQDAETRQFSRGPALWSLGVSLIGTNNPIELARAELGVVCEKTNANAALSRHVGAGNMHVVLHVGGAFDIHQIFRRHEFVQFPSGVASVFLAWDVPDRVQQIYASWKPERKPDGPLSSVARYLKHLGTIRKQGYNTGIIESPFPDVSTCYTEAPIFNESGQVVFVLSLSALTTTKKPVLRYFPEEVLQVAATLTRSIGGRSPGSGFIPESRTTKSEPQRISSRA
jgi:DNA-binding IclR family transcriptional regulator